MDSGHFGQAGQPASQIVRAGSAPGGCGVHPLRATTRVRVAQRVLNSWDGGLKVDARYMFTMHSVRKVTRGPRSKSDNVTGLVVLPLTLRFKSLWCRAGKEFKSRSSGLLSITLFQHAVILPARDGVTGQVFEFHGPRPRHSCFSGHSVPPRYVSLQEAIPSPS